jgi:hypothetical protein
MRALAEKDGQRVKASAALYLAATLEYVCSEILRMFLK